MRLDRSGRDSRLSAIGGLIPARRAEHQCGSAGCVASCMLDTSMGHAHGASSAHHHDHHHHAPPDGSVGRAFAIATGLNVSFVAVEAVFGVLTNSTALLADAAHNVGDVLGLVMAWVASAMARRKPSSQRTYGLRKTTVLAALANAVLLLVAVGGVSWEALMRFATPQPIPGKTVLIVAAIGVVINGASAVLFARGAHDDANLRGAFLHLLADAAVSVGVVFVGAVLLLYPTWLWLDPLVSLVISAVVAWGTWRLLRTALHLSLDGVPQQVDITAIRACLERLPGVTAVHDLHVWAMSTSETALTAHLVVDERTVLDLAGQAGRQLEEHFGIAHCTIQLDTPSQAEDCHVC